MASQFRSYDGRRTTVWMARLTSALPGAPCCFPGVTLAEGSKFIALIQATISGIYTMAMIISIVIYAIILNLPTKSRNKGDGDSNKVQSDDAFEDIQRRFGGGPLIFVVLSMAVVVGIACIAFHLYLYRAVKQRNARQVNLWWRGFLFMSILNTTLFITVLVNGTKGLSLVELSEVIFDMYCLWVIRMFFLELDRQDASVNNHVTVGFAAPTVA